MRHVSVVAVDPGHKRSGFAVMRPGRAPGDTPVIVTAGIMDNGDLVKLLQTYAFEGHTLALEKLQGMGMAVGQEVLETAVWSGRFIQAWAPAPYVRIPRISAKVHLCGQAKAKDPNVRQAIIDRFGGSIAKGTKAQPGPLYGISADMWAAVAIGLTFLEGDEMFDENGKVAAA